jgi:hypothetical protein
VETVRCIEELVDNGGVIGCGCEEADEVVVAVEEEGFFLLRACLVMMALDAFACFRNRSFCFRRSLI